jgi:hypothetical protein
MQKTRVMLNINKDSRMMLNIDLEKILKTNDGFKKRILNSNRKGGGGVF